MRILAVDDDNISLMKMKALLSSYGSVETASNGKEALKLIQDSFNSHNPFTLCTMDIEMPDMNGKEVVEKIRNLEKEKKVEIEERLRVMMVTIKKDEENIISSFYKGCEWYIKKPVTPENIKKGLLELNLINS